MNLKVIGCIFIFGCSVASGMTFVHKLNLHTRFLEDFIKFIAYAETNLQYSLTSIPDLMSSFKSDSLDYVFLLFQNEFSLGTTLKSAWSNAMGKLPKSYGLDDADKKLINDFVFGLGTSNVEGQVLHCKLYKELLMKNLSDARENQKKLSKVYLTCGAAIGAFVCLILL